MKYEYAVVGAGKFLGVRRILLQFPQTYPKNFYLKNDEDLLARRSHTTHKKWWPHKISSCVFCGEKVKCRRISTDSFIPHTIRTKMLKQVYQNFPGICPDFWRFCQDFWQIKTFGGALATSAPLPPTSLWISTLFSRRPQCALPRNTKHVCRVNALACVCACTSHQGTNTLPRNACASRIPTFKVNNWCKTLRLVRE